MRTPSTRRLASVALLLGVSGLAFALAGCSGDDAVSAADSGADGSLPDAPDGDGGACGAFSDASEPVLPTFVEVDGGVPLDSLALDLAIVECGYWAKCSPLAPFLVKNCIESLRQLLGTWSVASGLPQVFVPSVALFASIDAGAVLYDPNEAASCLKELQAEDCHGPTLWTASIVACQAVLSCAPTPGSGAGSNCSADDVSLFDSPTPTCTGEPGDCADAGGYPSGPHCLGNTCASAACGAYATAYCSSATAEGLPCDSDPPFLGGETLTGSKPCSSGTTCRGFTGADSGLGTCTKPEDVGGPCVTGTAITGCAYGLACSCGKCVLPSQ